MGSGFPQFVETSRAAFCVIDTSTVDTDEAGVLATRESTKKFDVDLLCVAELPTVVENVYTQLEAIRDAVHR